MFKRINSLFHPDRFQGIGKTRRYFEGWYFKMVSKDENTALAIIPGVAMDEKGVQHAFIQILDGNKLAAQYHTFHIDAFKYRTDRFDVTIGDNHFTNDRIEVNLPLITGKLEFKNLIKWPGNLFSPGIMGPFTFIPFMECNHGILSMDHSIAGSLKIKDEDVDFNGGRGYSEKDWGHSFPSAYFWMQSNHFSDPEISFKASVARIPWLGTSFTGFISGLWYKGRLYQFTTYNSTQITKSFADKDKVELMFRNFKHNLHITAHRNHETELASPVAGYMEGRISESMAAKIDVKLLRKNGTVIFEDTGRSAALEVAGEIDKIVI